MARRLSLAALALSLIACGSDDSTPLTRLDKGKLLSDRGRVDLPRLADRTIVSDVCALGTPQACGSCTTPCPGTDNAGTKRTCTSGKCDITCLGEYYDLDGSLQNGCEELDLPVQDTAATAVGFTLPDVKLGPAEQACDVTKNPCTVQEKIYSDNRTHDAPPILRPNGRDDWWRVQAIGAGVTDNTMTACLGITNFPSDNRYTVCITNNNSEDPTSCAIAMGAGQSVCVKPSGNPDSGLFYVRVQKSAGTNTPNKFALYLVH